MRRCEFVRIPYRDKDGTERQSVGFVCGSGATEKAKYPHCQSCLDEMLIGKRRPPQVRDGVRQCDHAIGGRDDRGLAKSCDKYICPEHTLKQGQFDYCPEHAPFHALVTAEQKI